MNTPTTNHDAMIAQLAGIVRESREQNERLDADPATSGHVLYVAAGTIRNKVLPLIGADEYQKFLETVLPRCLDPKINAVNITQNDLGDPNLGAVAFFDRAVQLGEQPLSLACVPNGVPLPRLYLSILDKTGTEQNVLYSPDTTARPHADEDFMRNHLYTGAIESCNGGLKEGSVARLFSNAVIQFGNGRLEDPTQLNALAQSNPDEYTARYLLGLPASLTEILKQAVGMNEECDTI